MEKHRRLVKYLGLLITTVLVGSSYIFMGPNGVDWKYYSTVSPSYQEFYFYREFIGWFLVDFINDLDQSGKLMAFLMSVFLFGLTFKISEMFSKSTMIAVLTSILLTFSNFYLLLSVNAIRQGISLIFILTSLYFNYKKRGYSSGIFFIFSIFSHNSALLFLPLLIVRNLYWPIYVLGCILLTIFGDFIIDIAIKNSNPSPTINKLSFMTVSLIIFGIGIAHKSFKKYDKKILDLANTVLLSQFYLIALGIAFFSSSAVYERIIYTSIPLLIIFSAYWLRFYRPKIVFMAIYMIVVISISAYSLTHPSVKNNFINL